MDEPTKNTPTLQWNEARYRIRLALAMIAGCIVAPHVIAGRRCTLVIRKAGGNHG